MKDSNSLPRLACPCGATVPNTSRYRGRFRRRHPSLCQERVQFTRQLAQGTRAVDYDDMTARGAMTTSQEGLVL